LWILKIFEVQEAIFLTEVVPSKFLIGLGRVADHGPSFSEKGIFQNPNKKGIRKCSSKVTEHKLKPSAKPY